MKKSGVILALTIYGSCGFAIPVPHEQPVLDKIGFKLSAKHWVKTKSALVNVNINATLNNTDLVEARAAIMDRLNKIAKGEWRLLKFERSQDNSGLEKLTVNARARVDQGALPDLYKHAKSVSKPGMSYTIESIEFKPSLVEVQQVKNKLRETLYAETNQEISRINTVYSDQKYSLHEIVFVEGDHVYEQKTNESRGMVSTMAMTDAQPPLTVSNEQVMTAIVQVASNRNQAG